MYLIPKYGSLKALLTTLPPSGTGVTESLALDHAPFTRITPSGTLFKGCTLSEKSPPFLGAFGLALWPKASNDTDTAETIKERKNPECITLLRKAAVVLGKSVANYFAACSKLKELARHLRVSPEMCRRLTIANAGSPVFPVAEWS